MTNREYLSQKSDKELARWILEEAINISRRYLDSLDGMTKWLNGDRATEWEKEKQEFYNQENQEYWRAEDMDNERNFG